MRVTSFIQMWVVMALVLGLANEASAQKIYWTEEGGKILRANLDASGIEELITGVGEPGDLALDVRAGKMHWTDTGVFESIRRANLDGSDIETVVSNATVRLPLGIALDVEAGQVFWADPIEEQIFRVNMDGSGPIRTVYGSVGADPSAIALDTKAQKVYWVDSNADTIRRKDIVGGTVEDLVTTGLADTVPNRNSIRGE